MADDEQRVDADAPEDRHHVTLAQDEKGKWSYALRDANGNVVFDGEGFDTKEAADEASRARTTGELLDAVVEQNEQIEKEAESLSLE